MLLGTSRLITTAQLIAMSLFAFRLLPTKCYKCLSKHTIFAGQYILIVDALMC